MVTTMNAQEQAYPFQNALLEHMALAGATLAAPRAPAAPASPAPAPLLAKGQLWQLNGAYVEIVNLEPRLVHYRVVRQRGQKTLTRVLKSEAFESYLKESGAVLVN